jgi:ADP-ribose pyrophosphatase YjhB (NUDIX family)
MATWGARLRHGARGRLPRALYELVTRLVPIACIDLLPRRTRGQATELGLIQRHDASGAVVWCLLGGGVHRHESLSEAAARHLRTTLGPGVTWQEPDYAHPATVGEYFPEQRPGAGHDPRKHAIALTYVVTLDGELSARGEALDFRWFAPADLPLAGMGFGQGAVVRRLLGALELS